jgi:hypothetical protein
MDMARDYSILQLGAHGRSRDWSFCGAPEPPPPTTEAIAAALRQVAMLRVGLALVAFGVGVARRPLLLPAALMVALLTLAGLGTAAWIADVGGKINHPEFRLRDAPVYDATRRLR